MKKRMLMVLSVAILAIPGLLLAQEDAVQARDQANAQVRVVNLKYYAASEMSNILQALSQNEEIQVIVDENVNRLILRASEKQMLQVLALIEQLDVETESTPESQSLLCRVYMVEVPPKHSDLESFQIVLAAPLDADLWGLSKAGDGKGLEIDRFDSHAVPEESSQRIEIQGRAVSGEIVKQMIAGIPDAQIREMRWAGKTSSDVTPVAQVSQLPEPLRQHLQKFLGADLQAVGYWFGGMSSPGKIKAPIGPWSIELEVKPTQTTNLSIEVGVQESRADTIVDILTNSMQGRVGKPIIIGYNRDFFGARTMGAMVILLEADTASVDLSQTKTP
jgi:hypothetical protein